MRTEIDRTPYSAEYSTPSAPLTSRSNGATVRHIIHPRRGEAQRTETGTPALRIRHNDKDARIPGQVPARQGAGVRVGVGRLPVGFRLAESGAIAHYVSASGPRAAQLLGSSPEEQGRIHEWIYWNELELGPVLVDLIQWRLGTASYESGKEEAAAAALKGHLAHLEGSLKGSTWLVDDQSGPSLADLTVGAAILFAWRFYIDGEMREGIPHTMAYLRRLREVDGLEELFTINMIEKRKQA
ncbi:hypothetical protein DL766_000081 [Monosporascus sp. MC13-8B]|uniref:GST C-terminal domain-containing protein n=1 Tax=Monosporascus cannonballus TaxID=155416 RepID=A0ABY0GXH0_9PEZI|nr:hypothetical protein DL762_008311 [Monosporascus cannonballus]RYO80271.1 hypothetical protein DL763_008979 [Monosporascus cannonballus]RYP40057.1 hypothetical protein DL766_000081 [Monosporascus sp. MC13-8B]